MLKGCFFCFGEGQELKTRPIHSDLLKAIGMLAYHLARMEKHADSSEGLKVAVVASEEESGGGGGGGRRDFVVFAFDKEYSGREDLGRFHLESLCEFLIIDSKDYALKKVLDERIVDDTSLQALFDKRQQELKGYMRDATPTYEVGEYLVGNLFISDEILDLLSLERILRPTYVMAGIVESSEFAEQNFPSVADFASFRLTRGYGADPL
ncbi:hypothetical protein L7F22_018289 [Adiantum nelumboides]|nr:hypothetical protein [Adiantum nelumboides]